LRGANESNTAVINEVNENMRVLIRLENRSWGRVITKENLEEV